MDPFFLSIETSALSVWLREAITIWAFPFVLILHTVGLAFLVGVNVAIDIRALGGAMGVPLAALRRYYRWMWAGFWVNALSGVVLVVIDATRLLANPLFYVKLGFIALAVVSGRLIAVRVFGDSRVDSGSLRMSRVLAAASLFFWIGAITAGRLTAYLFASASLSASAR